MKKFFIKLRMHYNGYEIGKNEAIMIKFYAQSTTFSFNVHIFNNRGVFDFLDEDSIKYRSEIYNFWIEDKSVRKQILNDVQKQLDFFEKQFETKI